MKKGLQPFTPVYTKDDAAQTPPCSQAVPMLTSVLTLSARGKLHSTVKRNGWAALMAVGKSGTHRCDAEKDSGLVLPVQTALNGVIGNGDYDKVLNRWGEGVERIPQSEINPTGLGD